MGEIHRKTVIIMDVHCSKEKSLTFFNLQNQQRLYNLNNIILAIIYNPCVLFIIFYLSAVHNK